MPTTEIGIVTNGTIVPCQSIVDVLAKYKVEVIISDYSEQLGEKSKVNDLIETLRTKNIPYYFEQNFGKLGKDKWYDLGNPFLSRNKSEDELKEFFGRCGSRCSFIWKDKLFNCSVLVGGILNAEYKEDEKNDFFDLKQEVRQDTMSHFIKYYLEYNNEGFYRYCNFCNGFGESINPYECVPGEQL